MAETINIPAVGPVKKPIAIAGVGILGGILIYAYWRRSRAAASATATDSSASSTDSAGQADTSGSSDYTDGESYVGGAEGVSPYAAGGYSSDCYYGINPTTGECLPGPSGSATYTTNSAWASAVENDLQTNGYSYSVIATAISKILAGLSVTSDQQSIFLQGIGLEGEPPQGYPKPIKVIDSPSQPSGGGGGGGNTGVPAPTTPSSVHATHVTSSSVSLSWHGSRDATGYNVLVDGATKASVGGTHDTIHGLRRGTRYTIGVQAYGHGGYSGIANITVTTHH
jgi:hypothetical protein